MAKEKKGLEDTGDLLVDREVESGRVGEWDRELTFIVGRGAERRGVERGQGQAGR